MSDKNYAGAQIDLLPCPFCGGTELHIETNSVQPDDYHDAWVHCDTCDADGCHGMLEGWLSSKDEAKAEAVTYWNRRVALARAGQQAGEAAGDVKRWQERIRGRALSYTQTMAMEEEIADLRAQLASAQKDAEPVA